MISKREKRQRDRIIVLETEIVDLKSTLVDFHVSITALQMRTTESIRQLKNREKEREKGDGFAE
jgi:hypothetical protein